nr:hypothetical protein [Micromonospora sp. DSM 115978]
MTDPYRLPARLVEVTAGPSPVAAPAGRMVVVVDQFEEAFTLAQDARERDGFVRGLCALARGDGFARPPVAVVIAVRADFYAYLAAYPELLGALQGGQVVLGPMTGADVREAIVEPAREAGKSVEPG